jgi:hypothetical protein
MARPRKARVEGAEAPVAAPEAVPYADRPEVAPLGETPQRPDPVPGNNGAALARIVAFFRAEHPEDWDDLALCPLQHGLDVMIKRLS